MYRTLRGILLPVLFFNAPVRSAVDACAGLDVGSAAGLRPYTQTRKDKLPACDSSCGAKCKDTSTIPATVPVLSLAPNVKFVYPMTGNTVGSPIYATDPSIPPIHYVAKSKTNKAAVHAGVLKHNEAGHVLITCMGQKPWGEFVASAKHGVVSAKCTAAACQDGGQSPHTYTLESAPSVCKRSPITVAPCADCASYTVTMASSGVTKSAWGSGDADPVEEAIKTGTGSACDKSDIQDVVGKIANKKWTFTFRVVADRTCQLALSRMIDSATLSSVARTILEKEIKGLGYGDTIESITGTGGMDTSSATAILLGGAAIVIAVLIL